MIDEAKKPRNAMNSFVSTVLVNCSEDCFGRTGRHFRRHCIILSREDGSTETKVVAPLSQCIGRRQIVTYFGPLRQEQRIVPAF